MTVGDRIKELRYRNKWTQKKLGEYSGIREETIRKYELGQRNPKLENLEKIAKALNVSTDYLLGGNGETITISIADYEQLLADKETLITIKELLYKSNIFSNSKIVGERIHNIRIKLGLNMEEFGKKLGTSKGAVNNWEKGVNLPNKERLKKISELGNVSIEFLLKGD